MVKRKEEQNEVKIYFPGGLDVLGKEDMNAYFNRLLHDSQKYDRHKKEEPESKALQKIREMQWKDIDYKEYNQSKEMYWISFLKKNFIFYKESDPMLKDLKIITKYACPEFLDVLHYMWYMKLHRDKSLFPISEKKLIINPVDFDLNNKEFINKIDSYVLNFEVKEFVKSTYSRKITDFEYNKYKRGLLESGEWEEHKEFVKGCAYNDKVE